MGLPNWAPSAELDSKGVAESTKLVPGSGHGQKLTDAPIRCVDLSVGKTSEFSWRCESQIRATLASGARHVYQSQMPAGTVVSSVQYPESINGTAGLKCH